MLYVINKELLIGECTLGCIVLTLLGQENFIFDPVSMVSEQKKKN